MANTTGKKFGGRQKGSSNQITTKTKEAITTLIEDSLEGLKSDLQQLSAKERLVIISGLLKYIIPTLKAQEVSVTTADQMPEWVGEILNDEYRSNV